MPLFCKTKNFCKTAVLLTVMISISANLNGQKKISFGLYADPVISWFKSDIKEVYNDGSRAGFNFGLTFNRYFSENYSFSTGINILTAGGRLAATDFTDLDLPDDVTVAPGKPVIYKMQYLSVPLGLKLQTNQIGYLTFFSDIGIDPKILLGGKLDVPSLSVDAENASSELRMFNLSYHITAGIEYSLGGSTSFVAGLGFENCFLDVTRENFDQPNDIITQKLIHFRLGVNF